MHPSKACSMWLPFSSSSFLLLFSSIWLIGRHCDEKQHTHTHITEMQREKAPLSPCERRRESEAACERHQQRDGRATPAASLVCRGRVWVAESFSISTTIMSFSCKYIFSTTTTTATADQPTSLLQMDVYGASASVAYQGDCVVCVVLGAE